MQRDEKETLVSSLIPLAEAILVKGTYLMASDMKLPLVVALLNFI